MHSSPHGKSWKVHVMQVILEEQEDAGDVSIDIGSIYGSGLDSQHLQIGHRAANKSAGEEAQATGWARQHAVPLFLYTLCLLVLLALLFATTHSSSSVPSVHGLHEPVLTASSSSSSSTRSMQSLRAIITEASNTVADTANRLADFVSDKSLAVHAGMH